MVEINTTVASIFVICVLFLSYVSSFLGVCLIIVGIFMYYDVYVWGERRLTSEELYNFVSSVCVWTHSGISSIMQKFQDIQRTSSDFRSENYGSNSFYSQDTSTDDLPHSDQENRSVVLNDSGVKSVCNSVSPIAMHNSSRFLRSSSSWNASDRSFDKEKTICTNVSSRHSQYKSLNYSPKGSPWGNSISPKIRGSTSGVRIAHSSPSNVLASKASSTNSGLFIDCNSPGFASRIVKYQSSYSSPTHQAQYSGHGQYPLVKLNKSKVPVLNPHNTQKLRTPVKVRIAPPNSTPPERHILHTVREPLPKDEPQIPTVLSVLQEISRKRMHAKEDEEETSDSIPKRQCNQLAYQKFSPEPILVPNGAILETVTQGKRSLEESPQSPEKPITKRVRNNEIFSSLSSSRKMPTKRKAECWSRSSTPDLMGKLCRKSSGVSPEPSPPDASSSSKADTQISTGSASKREREPDTSSSSKKERIVEDNHNISREEASQNSRREPIQDSRKENPVMTKTNHPVEKKKMPQEQVDDIDMDKRRKSTDKSFSWELRTIERIIKDKPPFATGKPVYTAEQLSNYNRKRMKNVDRFLAVLGQKGPSKAEEEEPDPSAETTTNQQTKPDQFSLNTVTNVVQVNSSPVVSTSVLTSPLNSNVALVNPQTGTQPSTVLPTVPENRTAALGGTQPPISAPAVTVPSSQNLQPPRSVSGLASGEQSTKVTSTTTSSLLSTALTTNSAFGSSTQAFTAIKSPPIPSFGSPQTATTQNGQQKYSFGAPTQPAPSATFTAPSFGFPIATSSLVTSSVLASNTSSNASVAAVAPSPQVTPAASTTQSKPGGFTFGNITSPPNSASRNVSFTVPSTTTSKQGVSQSQTQSTFAQPSMLGASSNTAFALPSAAMATTAAASTGFPSIVTAAPSIFGSPAATTASQSGFGSSVSTTTKIDASKFSFISPNTTTAQSTGFNFSSSLPASKSGGFSFGSSPVVTQSSGFGFGSPAITTSASATSSQGLFTMPQSTSANSSLFGDKKSFSFGSSAGNTAPMSQFGTSAGNAAPTSQFSATAGNAASAPQFGTTAGNTGSAPQFGTTAGNTPSAPQFGTGSTPQFGTGSAPQFGTGSAPQFGTTAVNSAAAPQFGTGSAPQFGTAAGNSAPAPQFGTGSEPQFGTTAGNSAAAPQFGTTAGNSAPAPQFGTNAGNTPSAPQFGTTAGNTTAASPFGTMDTGSNSATTTATSSASSGGFKFDLKPSTGAAATTTTSIGFGKFNFGGTTTTATPFGSTQKPTFSLGATTTAPQTATTSVFGFGAANAQPASSSSSSSGQGLFQFGSSTSSQQPQSSGAFAFGASNNNTSSTGATTQQQQGSGFSFATAQQSTGQSGAFSFGAASTSAPPFSFGQSQPQQASSNQMQTQVYEFGGSQPAAQSPAAGFSSGQPSMFNIGSGSTAPRTRVTRSRRPR